MTEASEKYRFGPLRSRATRKPFVTCPSVDFFRCKKCGAVLSSYTGVLTSLPICCGTSLERLEFLTPDKNLDLSYTVIGGLNENAIKVSWNNCHNLPHPEWIYLRSFTGGQIKYLQKNRRPPVLFALADEDAYAYCDKDPCGECTFRCKRGFELYFYYPELGLFRLPLERMSTHPKL